MWTNNTRGFVLQLLKIKLNMYFNLYPAIFNIYVLRANLIRAIS